MKRRLEVFSGNEVIRETVPRKLGDPQEGEIPEGGGEALDGLFRQVEQELKTPYLIFDLDGTLFPYGQESMFIPATIKDYVAENKDMVDKFRRRIEWFRERGFHVMINTGRPVDFAQRAARYLFPHGSIESIVGENGAVFAKREGDKDATETSIEYPSYFNRDQVASFQEKCKPIVELAESLGGFLSPENKLVAVTLYPKEVGVPGEAAEKSRQLFCEEMRKGIESRGLQNELIVHYPASVDITPLEVTKARTEEEILGDKSVGVFFGDSSSDEEAMSTVAVNIALGNASPSTKTQARRAEIGLVANFDRKDIKGVVDALSTMEAYMRLRKKKEKGQ